MMMFFGNVENDEKDQKGRKNRLEERKKKSPKISEQKEEESSKSKHKRPQQARPRGIVAWAWNNESSGNSFDDDDSDSCDKPGAIAVPGFSSSGSRGRRQQERQHHCEDPGDAEEPPILVAKIVHETDDTDDELYKKSGNMIDEKEKKRIEQQAKQDVRLKVYGEAVEAEAADFDAEARRKRLHYILSFGGLLVLLLVAGGIGLAFAFKAQSQSEQTVESPRTIPTASPTIQPPIFAPPASIDLILPNNVCENAFDIATTIGEPFFGNMTNAEVAPVDTCGDIFRNGVGVWYVLDGSTTNDVDGVLRRYRASTCDNSFDTQISIFKGECGKLQCLAGNDQTKFCGNGDQSLVVFATEPNTKYYIYMHARRQAHNVFQLSVDEFESNDDCDTSTPLEFLNSFSTPSRFGSTRGATTKNNQCSLGSIPSLPANAPGVWYSVVGTEVDFGYGEYMTVVFESVNSNNGFSPRVFVYEGGSDEGCGSLTCVSSTGKEWPAEEGVTYYILIYGNQAGSEGDFRITIERSDTRAPTPSPTYPIADGFAHPCFSASSLFPGDMRVDSTAFRRDFPMDTCGNLVFNTSPGVWYEVAGTGNVLTASTCESTSNFDTQISVFRGSCFDDIFECIDGNDQACGGDQSSVSWFSEIGTSYYVIGKFPFVRKKVKTTPALTSALCS